jgi:hypothetical protein
MRRGSKSPSMLLLDMQKEIARERSATKPTSDDDSQKRRLSLVSALKVSLENVAIIDEHSKQQQLVSASESRSLTLNVLSQASELQD